MKLLESTEKKIDEDINGKNVPHLEISEVVLVHFNGGNNDYQQSFVYIYMSLYILYSIYLFQTNHFFNC